MFKLARAFPALLILAACAGPIDQSSSSTEDDLGSTLGSVQGSAKWGGATTCKVLPAGLPKLVDPVVVVSIDGLTLHLWDRQGTFDKVYPIGPGAVENGVSLTPVGHFSTGPADPTAGAIDSGAVIGSSPWAWWYRCKMWWTDPVTKVVSPVYGGLPLIRLKGAPTLGYAIHGPIDSFGSASGGSLRRGLVSHGCVRMRAEDITEVFVLLHGHPEVPVTIQLAPERDQNGKRVDLAQRWIGSECDADADCNFTGGACHANAYGHAFCTAACAGSCNDLPGEIATACVADGSGGKGMCIRQASALNNECRSNEGFRFAAGTRRFGRATTVDACVPGSEGFVGDSCLSTSDCTSGRTCELHGARGLCTEACNTSQDCPSANGLGSACVANRCLRTCDVQDACGAALPETCAKASGAVACIPG